MCSGFRGGSVIKNLPASAWDAGVASLIPGLGRPPGGGNCNRHQYPCLENPKYRGAWRVIVHRITKSGMTEQLSTYATATHIKRDSDPLLHIKQRIFFRIGKTVVKGLDCEEPWKKLRIFSLMNAYLRQHENSPQIAKRILHKREVYANSS